MAKETPFIISLLLFIFTEVEGANESYGINDNNPVKLFVFGDSYVDIGNFVHSESYKPPSGVTFPGKSDLPAFMESLVKQISINLKRIHSLGINKIAIGLLQPIGCLPVLNVISFLMNCIGFLNSVSKDHNKMLLQAVQELNKEIGKSVFITLDLYNSFLSAIATIQKRCAENSTLMNPLQPCCEGVNLGAHVEVWMTKDQRNIVYVLSNLAELQGNSLEWTRDPIKEQNPVLKYVT
ncbi:GDSL esterase/lipase [Spatholobus suberectus]|nr:GDSL esterase/lipase [Spatholobus suberectus]